MTDWVHPHIPTEVYVGFLGTTIPIHWNYHAIFMISIWFVMVPLCIVTIRFGKPKPTLNGIREEVRPTNAVWWWFSVHKFGLMFAVGLSLVGMAVALYASGGFSGSLHSFFGTTTIALGCLQVVWAGSEASTVAEILQSRAGRPLDLARRSLRHDAAARKFEAYHKTAGYFVFIFVSGALATGLMQYPMPALAGVILSIMFVVAVACIVWSTKDFATTGTARLDGYNLEHCLNKEREHL